MLSFTLISGYTGDAGWKPFHILSTSRRHREEFEMFKRILIVTDGSEGATAALRVAVEMAAADAELVVLNVFDRGEPTGARGQELRTFAQTEHLSGDHAEARRIFSEDVLAEAKAIVDKRSDLRASFVSCGGDPTEEILRYADKVRPNVVVVGSRGRGRLAGLFLGSVSQKVVSLARQPILIVPTES
jgi:nucleotide-binding universal stress UspA family protein